MGSGNASYLSRLSRGAGRCVMRPMYHAPYIVALLRSKQAAAVAWPALVVVAVVWMHVGRRRTSPARRVSRAVASISGKSSQKSARRMQDRRWQQRCRCRSRRTAEKKKKGQE